ncbi:MAG TPA: hypothetical protein VFV17_00885 [Usitatibacteraceae bacterium]|nr:hypothetical protein [Usitatibacteraceae bacterium]
MPKPACDIPLTTTARDRANSPDPIIGATLCLMTCTLDRVAPADLGKLEPAYVAKVADNLLALSRHPLVDPLMRRICGRLFEHWEAAANSLRG